MLCGARISNLNYTYFRTSSCPVRSFNDIWKEAVVKVWRVRLFELIFRVDGQVVTGRLFAKVLGDGLPCVCAPVNNGKLFPAKVIQQSYNGLCHLDIGGLQTSEGLVYRTIRYCRVRTFLQKKYP